MRFYHVFLIFSVYFFFKETASSVNGDSDEQPGFNVNNNHLFGIMTGIREMMGQLATRVGNMEVDIAKIKNKIDIMQPTLEEMAKQRLNFNHSVTLTNRIGKTSDCIDLPTQPAAVQNININHQCSENNLQKAEVYSDVTKTFDNVMKNDKFIQRCENSFRSHAAHEVASPNLMPVSKINGTELYSGIFYKMGMKRFPEGWVTWTNELDGDGSNFVQIDLDAKHFPLYETGRSYEYDNQWLFGETETPGYYTFMNRGILNGLATLSFTKKGSGNLLSLATTTEQVTRLSKGGNLRDDAMWAPTATNEENYYKLTTKQVPQAVVTWTYEKYRNISHYIIAATKEEDLNHYQPEGKWYDDSLFKFQPAELILESRVFNFQFKNTMQDILKNDSVSHQEASVIEIIHRNEKDSEEAFAFDETTTRENTFNLRFKEPKMKMFSKAKIQLSLPMSADCIETSFQKSSRVGSEQILTVTQTKATKILAEIKIPKLTTTNVSVTSEWVENFKFPFTAKMEITGTASRLMDDESGRIAQGPVPSAIVLQFLKSMGNTDMKIVKKSESNGVIVEVTGTLTATFGTRTIVQCDSCHVDSIALQQSSFIA
jgi:hypothetical protein